MKEYSFFQGKGKFYKANLHCHTVISDGKFTKEEIKDCYQKEGYSIVAFTDHMVYGYHPELSDEKFLAIAGIEINFNEKLPDPEDFNHTRTYHLNFYDLHPEKGKTVEIPDIPYEDKEGLNRFILKMGEEGFLACYNHPYWSLQNYEDYKDLKGLFAMEIYNHGCELDGLYGYHPQSYDEMLRAGQHLYCVATDDNHNGYPLNHPLSDSFGGFLMVKSESLAYGDVMKALETGNFYFSMGPEIQEAYVEGNILKVKTSPAEKIYLVQDGRNCGRALAPKGETITEAEFTLTGKERYVRVVVRDAYGKFAGTNPYFPGEER